MCCPPPPHTHSGQEEAESDQVRLEKLKIKATRDRLAQMALERRQNAVGGGGWPLVGGGRRPDGEGGMGRPGLSAGSASGSYSYASSAMRPGSGGGAGAETGLIAIAGAMGRQVKAGGGRGLLGEVAVQGRGLLGRGSR